MRRLAHNRRMPVLKRRPGATPLVLDSPHSGTDYPDDFRFACDAELLRRAEDTHVEKLYDFAPALGAAWVEALFPRSYLDVNRNTDEIDPALFDAPWPGPMAGGSKVELGKGLIWRLTDEGEPIYDRKLTVAEGQSRIAECWLPYHAAVAEAIHAAHSRHGYSIHLNCHSMPSVAGSHATLFPGEAHADFVIGNRDGSTSGGGVAEAIVDFLAARGHSVTLNHPYKGVELVRRHGRPHEQRHSVQVEINRRLYMNEATLALHDGFAPLQATLKALIEHLLAFDPAALKTRA